MKTWKKGLTVCVIFAGILLTGCERNNTDRTAELSAKTEEGYSETDLKQDTEGESVTEQAVGKESADERDTKEKSAAEQTGADENSAGKNQPDNFSDDNISDTNTSAERAGNTETQQDTVPLAARKESSEYRCDFEADREAFDGEADIVVGDNLYSTQINDWYINFDVYEGKTVEIEGFYIGEFAPYDFVGRYGPSCPYCQGGYVCFEILTDQDMSSFASEEDWIKVTGILRRGVDTSAGEFYYIEALELEKMEETGVTTVGN